MGTISEKLTYLNGTKQELKQAINNIGGEVTDETTFREYVNQLENAYDNLPKTEYQEGTEITIENTLKGKLDYENGVVGIGQTEQDGTPTPDTPIDIQCATGNQEEVVRGKNELDESTLLQGAWNGTTTKRVYFYANNYLNAGTYTIMTDLNTTDFRYAVNIASNQFPLGSGMSINVYDSSWITTSYKTFTLSQGGYLGVGVKRANEGDIVPSDISSYHFMIYEGEYDSSISYEPYITPTSYQLSLGDKKFYGIPNTDYRDELVYDINEDKVYKKSNTIRYTADELTWSHFSVTQGDLFRTTPIDTIKGTSGYSNYYICKTQSTRTDPCFYVNADNPLIDVIDNRYSDTTNFKNWCVANNVEWIIPRATPTLTEITDTTLKAQVKALYNAHSNNGTTIITSNGDLPMIIKVRGLKGE